MSSRPRTPSTEAPCSAQVCVPASTSNLGPGFDLLGLALSLWLEARVTPLAPAAAAHELERRGGASAELGDPRRERVLEAFDRAAEHLRLPGAFRFELDHGIPVGRGFGSSGAATAAGLLLAAALHARRGAELPRERLLPWGIELEGHPDNVTASLFGGLTLCHPDPDGAGPARIAHPVHPSIRIALAWSRETLPTARAREILPTRVPRADAVENPRRLALLLEGLRNADPRLLAAGGEERLHVAHRLPLITGGAQALEAAREAGAWMATISGAGSGLVALAGEREVDGVVAAMADALRRATGHGEARAVEVVREPPTVRLET